MLRKHLCSISSGQNGKAFRQSKAGCRDQSPRFLDQRIWYHRNLALALAVENNVLPPGNSEKDVRSSIGLFKKDFQRRLRPRLRTYLSRQKLVNWYDGYAKNFRDALAHRIPPYVPPSGLNKKERTRFRKLNQTLEELGKQGYSEKYSAVLEEQLGLGSASPFYVHSFSEESNFVYLHPQILADFRTVEEMIEKVLRNFFTNKRNTKPKLPGI